MKRYDLKIIEAEKAPCGEWMRHEDVSELIEAARKLVKAKGRFHTEQNYKALEAALKRLEGT